MKKNALIVVADHKKVRFIHMQDFLHVQEWEKEKFENHILEYSDKPGRTFNRMGMGRHALADKISNRERAEEALTIRLSSYLRHRINDFDFLYLVVDPKIEGAFKAHCSSGVKLKWRKTIHKRLVDKPVKEIWEVIKEEIEYDV